MAGLLEISQSAVANYEQGTRFPDEGTLLKIARIFGTSLDYLLGNPSGGAGGDRPLSGPKNGSGRAEIEGLREEYEEAFFSMHWREAIDVLTRRAVKSFLLSDIFEAILIPALHEIGNRWESGMIDIAQEHLFTGEMERTMDILSFLTPASPETGGTCAAFSPGAELHTLGAKMVHYLMRSSGWNSFFLGSNTPTSEVISFCLREKIEILALSVTMPRHIDSLTTLIKTLREKPLLERMKIIVGGRSFSADPLLWKKVGADGYASSAAEAVGEAVRLLGKGKPERPSAVPEELRID